MGLLTGSGAWGVMRFKGPLPLDWREQFKEGIYEHLHAERLESRSKEANVGWTRVGSPTDTALTVFDWLYEDLVVLGVRTDKKAINGKMLETLVDKEVARRMAERGGLKIGKKWRKEIKEAVEEELLAKQTPSLKTGEFVMDLEEPSQDGYVDLYFFGGGPTFEMLMDSFGIKPWQDRYSDWLFLSGWEEGAICEGLTRIFGAGHQRSMLEEDDRYPDLFQGHYVEIGQDFLTWLWFAIDSAGGTLLHRMPGDHAEWEIWLEGKVVLSDEKHKVNLTGEVMSEMPEAIDALGSSRRPSEIQIGVRRGDLEWTMTLVHKLYSTWIKGCKLHKSITGSSDDDLQTAIFDRFGQVRQLQKLVRSLFSSFFTERIRGDFDERISSWVGAREAAYRDRAMLEAIEDALESPIPARPHEPGPVDQEIERRQAGAAGGDAVVVQVDLGGGVVGTGTFTKRRSQDDEQG